MIREINNEIKKIEGLITVFKAVIKRQSEQGMANQIAANNPRELR